MWVQVRVRVGTAVLDPIASRVSPVGIFMPVVREDHLEGPMWARSEDLPPVTPENPVPVMAYKRTVQVRSENALYPERVFRLDGAWSPQPGQLIADWFEEIR